MFSESIDHIPFDFAPPLTSGSTQKHCIELDPAGVDRAIAISQTISESLRWPAYLTLLALEGFSIWVEEINIPVELRRSQARLLPPLGLDLPAAITHLMLNPFRVCLVVVSADEDEAIELPVSVVDTATQVAHFYVAVSVDEENLQAQMQGFLRYDQLRDLQQQQLRPTAEQTYILPRTVLDQDMHHLLLFAVGLNQGAIALPSVSVNLSLPSVQQVMIQPMVNTAHWLRQQVDRLRDGYQQLADELILTGFSTEMQLANAMRSNQSSSTLLDGERIISNNNLTMILQNLAEQGFDIPEQVSAVYQDIVIDNGISRISMISWPLASSTAEPEWSLLVILEMLAGIVPSEGISFSVRDQTIELSEKVLQPGAAYEAAQVIGSLEEQFIVVFTAPSGDSIMLPPLIFQN